MYRKEDLSGIKSARAVAFALLFAALAAAAALHGIFADMNFAAIVCIVCAAALIAGIPLFRRIVKDEAALVEANTAAMRNASYFLYRYEAAVKQIKDGVVILTEDGSFVLINETAKTILGITDADLRTARYDEVVSGFSEKMQREEILAAAKGGVKEDSVSYAGAIYRIRFAPLGEGEEDLGVVVVISDVTESYKAEDMQTDFVANVSHELKTPLTTVKSYSQTLLEGGLDDPAMTREFLEIIDSEADRMDRLVRDLLLMTRIDNSRQKWDMTENDLAALVKTAMKKMDMTAKAKALSLNRMFEEDFSVMAEMDRDRLEQVVLNILSNAIKYTDEKGRIDVDLIPGENCVQIVISDNGVGIPEKAQARVFERFFIVDKARSRKMGGTGLGLAISKQIVEEHGGAIVLESKYGKGTKVTITLPACKVRGKRGIL
ncbi:MAG: cell wall metabolism sensor histidine kinase WalK [Clostridiales Family XIII bacterium]|jgi:two-component system sensor histidine kinase VicK|nr:cell wall metabolism sensor histidine kinase WalK [Clostridiales Family XIII bacterium]